MAYTPNHPDARFAKPLLNQIIAILQRDQAGALGLINTVRAANGEPGLTPVSEYHKGPAMRTAFPWLTVMVEGPDFQDDGGQGTEDGMPIPERITAEISLDVGQFDQEDAQDQGQDYLWLLYTVIDSCDNPAQNAGPDTSWETQLAIVHSTVPGGLTTPNASGTVKRVQIHAARQSVRALDQIEKPVLNVTITVAFYLKET